MFKELLNANNLEELKKMYRKLAIKFHPDHYHDDGTAFIELQKEFERLHDKLKNSDKKAKNHTYTATDFMNIINKIMKYNVTIEIIGSWIWVSGGETFNIKDDLKKMKFWWSRKNKSWIYSGEAGKTRRKATNRNAREVYNVEVLRTQKVLSYSN